MPNAYGHKLAILMAIIMAILMATMAMIMAITGNDNGHTWQ